MSPFSISICCGDSQSDNNCSSQEGLCKTSCCDLEAISLNSDSHISQDAKSEVVTKVVTNSIEHGLLVLYSAKGTTHECFLYSHPDVRTNILTEYQVFRI